MSEPPTDLYPGEKVIREIASDRARYWRDLTAMGAISVVFVFAVLWLMGNQFLLIGTLGVVLAVAVRGLYLVSEQLSQRWWLTTQRLILPSGGAVMLLEIDTVRRLFSDVQVITKAGHKHLMKHIADADGLVRQISDAREKRRRAAR